MFVPSVSLFAMSQGVHIPFAWCMLQHRRRSLCLKETFKTLFHIVNFHRFCCMLYREGNELRGRKRKGVNIWHNPTKETHSTHRSWIIFSPSGLSDNQTLKMNNATEVSGILWQSLKKTSKNKQQATAAASVPTCNTVRLHVLVFVCDIQGENRKTLGYVSFYRRRIFSLVFVCVHSVRHSMSSC